MALSASEKAVKDRLDVRKQTIKEFAAIAVIVPVANVYLLFYNGIRINQFRYLREIEEHLIVFCSGPIAVFFNGRGKYNHLSRYRVLQDTLYHHKDQTVYGEGYIFRGMIKRHYPQEGKKYIYSELPEYYHLLDKCTYGSPYGKEKPQDPLLYQGDGISNSPRTVR